MPMYSFQCEEGHVTTLKLTYVGYDAIRGDSDTIILCLSCWTDGNHDSPAKIKVYPPEFNITPGIWDDLGTGSIQEDELRREGYF